jgi:hypothetical protein
VQFADLAIDDHGNITPADADVVQLPVIEVREFPIRATAQFLAPEEIENPTEKRFGGFYRECLNTVCHCLEPFKAI